jgi:hypothetical protein
MIDDPLPSDDPSAEDTDASCVPVTPSAAEILQRHMDRLKASSRSYRPAPPTRSPMDEAMWFQIPNLYQFAMSGGAVTVLQPNPQRVAVIFQGVGFAVTETQSNDLTGGGAIITATGFTPAPVDIAMQNNSPPTANTGTASFHPSQEWFTWTADLSGYVGASTSTSIVLFPLINFPQGGDTINYGYVLDTYQSRLHLTQAEYGPLAQCGWIAYSQDNGSEILTVTELVLRDWPKNCG